MTGQGTTVVAQGRLAAHWFVGRELVFAVAMTEASHDVAQWIAKVYPVPMSSYYHTYIAALIAGCVFCGISLCIAIIYFYYISGLTPHHSMTMCDEGHVHTKKYHMSHQQRRQHELHNSNVSMGAAYGDMKLTLEQATSLLDPRRFTIRFFLSVYNDILISFTNPFIIIHLTLILFIYY